MLSARLLLVDRVASGEETYLLVEAERRNTRSAAGGSSTPAMITLQSSGLLHYATKWSQDTDPKKRGSM